jgi:hypothetical protein
MVPKTIISSQWLAQLSIGKQKFNLELNNIFDPKFFEFLFAF